MFNAPMERFSLELKLDLPWFSGFTSSHLSSCVLFCRPFVVLTIFAIDFVGCRSFSNSNSQLPKPGDRRNFDTQQNLLKISWERRKTYRKKHKYLNGTTVKTENKVNPILIQFSQYSSTEWRNGRLGLMIP